MQDKDQTIAALTTENDNLTSALKTAESRLTELYAEQNRMEEEMAARIDITEKLRTQVRELEKDKRDIQRRYNEQVRPSMLLYLYPLKCLARLRHSRRNAKHSMITSNISSHAYNPSPKLASNQHHR